MSFRKYKYTDKDGLTHPIRLSSQVAAAQGAAASPGGPYDSLISADVQNSRREIGLAPRKVALERRAGAEPNVKVYYNTMPVVTEARAEALVTAGTVDIGGVTWDVVRIIPEDPR